MQAICDIYYILSKKCSNIIFELNWIYVTKKNRIECMQAICDVRLEKGSHV